MRGWPTAHGSGCGRATASVVGLWLRCFNCRKANYSGGVRVLNCSSRMPKTIGIVIPSLVVTQSFRPHQNCRRLLCGKGLATHSRVDGIECAQAMNIRNATHRYRIAQILNLAIHSGERRPRGKARAIWVTRSRDAVVLAARSYVDCNFLDR